MALQCNILILKNNFLFFQNLLKSYWYASIPHKSTFLKFFWLKKNAILPKFWTQFSISKQASSFFSPYTFSYYTSFASSHY
jgi:hypothetical protein